MAGNERFHSKYHSKSHHTNTTPGYFDSGSDPIASPTNPFQGSFTLNGTFSGKSIIADSLTVPTLNVSVISAGTVSTSIKAVTGNYTILITDQFLILHGGVSGSNVLLPPASAAANLEFTIKTNSTTQVSLCAVGSDKIDETYSAIFLTSQYTVVQLAAFNNGWWIYGTF